MSQPTPATGDSERERSGSAWAVILDGWSGAQPGR